MNIAELILNLGVKGSDKTASALGSMQKGLKETSSIALETKVAIAGAVYALERLFAASGQRGTDLSNFNAVTGISVQRMQQYDYAARQVGASNDEMESTFKSLQSQMAKVGINQGAPMGMATVASRLGIDISQEDINEFAKKPEKLLQILQQYAQVEKNKPLRNETLKTLGISDNIIAGLDKGVFNEKNLAKAPTYSDKQVNALDKNNIKVQNLKASIEMEIGKLYAKHGDEIIDDVTKIIGAIIKLGEAFGTFAEKIGLFDTIMPLVIDGWTKIIQLLTAFVEKFSSKGIVETIHDYALGSKEENTAYDKQKADEKMLKTKIQANTAKGIAPPKGYTPEGDLEANTMFYTKPKTTAQSGTSPSPVAANTPPSPVGAPAPKQQQPAGGKVIPITAAVKVAKPVILPQVHNTATSNEVNVNQTLNFNHDGTNAQKIGGDHKKAANDAYRQLPQGQVK